MSKEIVSVKNVTVEFDGVTVLKDNDFSVKENDFIGIIGPNGGGKTTLLKVILGLIRPTSGSVEVFGTEPAGARHFVGYVPQLHFFDRDFPINVWEVALMGRLSQRGMLRRFTEEDKKITEEALKSMEVLDLKDRQIGKLSGGERQRVLIARALAGRPKLLLLDEPTASVDVKMKTGIYEVLEKLKKEMAIVLVTHDMGAVSTHVEKIACLNCRIFYHDSKEITKEAMEAVYHCPVDIIAHGLPHRVLEDHDHEKEVK